MPTLICRNCGHETNTALANWINSKDGKADSCYARFVNDKWEKGCGYDKGDNFIKRYVADLVKKDIRYTPGIFDTSRFLQ